MFISFLWGVLPGGFLARGVFVQGVFVLEPFSIYALICSVTPFCVLSSCTDFFKILISIFGEYSQVV